MSVTFSIGHRVAFDLDHLERSLNLNNPQRRRPPRLARHCDGRSLRQHPARELAAHCRRRLWAEARNLDPKLPDEHVGALRAPRLPGSPGCAPPVPHPILATRSEARRAQAVCASLRAEAADRGNRKRLRGQAEPRAKR